METFRTKSGNAQIKWFSKCFKNISNNLFLKSQCSCDVFEYLLVFCGLIFPFYWSSIFPIAFIYKIIYLFIYLLLFRVTPVAYEGSQAWDGIGSTAASPCPSHNNVVLELPLWTTPQLMEMLDPNPLSGAGIEPMFSWTLAGFITTEPQQSFFLFFFCNVESLV